MSLDLEISLLEPAQGSPPQPLISIVIPALNEEVTINDFIDWCWQGLQKAGVSGEILIIDSGTDHTTAIALSKGARVLKTPRRGLGRAYIDALPFIRGDLVMMGDCDCTYDFRELLPFIEKYREGFEFIMGSRFRGSIAHGAMPRLHQYFGTPVTTWILNTIYGSAFTDIHCGMRGISSEALMRMQLQSQGWEYASEMVLKSVHMGLRTAEVPVCFYCDRAGRVSHHKRLGWLSPWRAGWDNLKAMFIYGAHFFLFKPSFILIAGGCFLTLPQALSFAPAIAGIGFSLYWMLLGLTFTVFGVQCFFMGILAKLQFDYSGKVRHRWTRIFDFDRTVLLSAVIFVTGGLFCLPLVREYCAHQFRLTAVAGSAQFLAVEGLLFLIVGFMTFTFTLLLHANFLRINQVEKAVQ